MIDYKNPAALRELMEKVTEGPWVAKNYCPELNKTDSGSVETQDGKHLLRWWGSSFVDAHFAALSREALPYWIARAEKAEQAVERLLDALDHGARCPQRGMWDECRDYSDDAKCRACRKAWAMREGK